MRSRIVTTLPRSSKVIVKCRRCGEDYPTTIGDAPPEEAQNRVNVHRECNQKYKQFIKELDALLQEWAGR